MRQSNKRLPKPARRLRQLRGTMTQRELGEKTGLSAALICLYENGLQITAESADAFAAFFEVPATEFWTPPTFPKSASKAARQ